MTKICVYAICKDEGKFIDGWLQNVMPAEYIAILDTGSQDLFYNHLLAVKELVNQAAGYEKIILKQAKIQPWRFDVARNESMKLIPKDADLCICTDIDERLAEGWADVLRENWQGQSRVLYDYAWGHSGNGAPTKIFVYDKCHVNDDKHFWKYPVHETLTVGDADADYREAENALRINSDHPFLEHFQDEEKARQTTYGELLELRMREFPNEAQSYSYLFAQYAWEQKWQKIIDFATTGIVAIIKYNKYDNCMLHDAYLYISEAFLQTGDFASALKFARHATAELPNERDGYLQETKVLVNMGELQEARERLYEGMQKGSAQGYWSERPDTYTWMPYYLMALTWLDGKHSSIVQDWVTVLITLKAPQNIIDDLLKQLN